MMVRVMSHAGDEEMAGEVVEVARRCSGDHDVQRLHRDADGNVDGLPGVTLVQRNWPAVCTEMFQALVRSVPDGTLLLNLEPDAVLTSIDALDRIERAVQNHLRRWPDLLVLGHWKTPPVTPQAPVEHMSGCSVYVCTPALKEAIASCSVLKSWDLELFFRDILQPGEGMDLPEIRCLWGTPIMPRRVLDDYPLAALIHGDKSGGLLRLVRRKVFGFAD